VVVERGMSGRGVRCCLAGTGGEWVRTLVKWDIPKVLYRCEHQGGPLRIFAHDLDLPLMHAVTGGLDPVHFFDCYCPRAIAWVLSTNRVAVKSETPSPIFPSPNSLVVRRGGAILVRSREEGGRGHFPLSFCLFFCG